MTDSNSVFTPSQKYVILTTTSGGKFNIFWREHGQKKIPLSSECTKIRHFKFTMFFSGEEAYPSSSSYPLHPPSLLDPTLHPPKFQPDLRHCLQSKHFEFDEYVNKSVRNCQEPAEVSAARDMFGGRLTEDFIADKVGHSNFADLRQLEFPQSGIQSVILCDGRLFNNLQRFFKFLIKYTLSAKGALGPEQHVLSI